MEEILGPSGRVDGQRGWFYRLEGRYREALDAWSTLPEDGVVDDHLRYIPTHLRLAEVDEGVGRPGPPRPCGREDAPGA